MLNGGAAPAPASSAGAPPMSAATRLLIDETHRVLLRPVVASAEMIHWVEDSAQEDATQQQPERSEQP